MRRRGFWAVGWFPQVPAAPPPPGLLPPAGLGGPTSAQPAFEFDFDRDTDFDSDTDLDRDADFDRDAVGYRGVNEEAVLLASWWPGLGVARLAEELGRLLGVAIWWEKGRGFVGAECGVRNEEGNGRNGRDGRSWDLLESRSDLDDDGDLEG